MSSENEFVESAMPQRVAALSPERAESHSRDESPKRPQPSDSSVHESSLSEHAGDTDDDISAASSNDSPISESSVSDAGDADKLLDDEGLKAVCDRALSNLKGALTRKSAEFDREYEFYAIDDDIRADFFHFVLDNLVNLDKISSGSLESGEIVE
jgi:hypothetical protein